MPDFWKNIPLELRCLSQWCLWRLEERTNRHGKVNKTKVPYSAQNLRLTGSTADHAKEWTDFNTAWTALETNEDQFSGLMFNFTDTPYFGIDFDHKAKDGKIVDAEVEKWVQKFATYTEFSQSGHGVHVIGKAILDMLKQRGLKREDIGVEIYATGRCFVMTGKQIAGTPVTIPDCYTITRQFIEVIFADKLKKEAEKKQQQKQKRKKAKQQVAAQSQSQPKTSLTPPQLPGGTPAPLPPGPGIPSAVGEPAPNFWSGFLTIAGVNLDETFPLVVTKRGVIRSNTKYFNSKLADLLASDNRFIATDRLFAWHPARNCYELTTEDYIPPMIEQVYRFIDREEYSPGASKAIIEIMRSRYNIHDPDGVKLNNYPDIIGFANGFYSIAKNILMSGDPDYFLTYALPWNYNPDAKCPEYHKFMEEVLPDPKARRWVELYCAYAMTSSIKYQDAEVWWGVGNNGKTTLIELLLYIWGPLAQQVPLQKFGDPVWKINLRGCLLNVVADLPETAIQDEGDVKAVITDDTLTGRGLYHPPTKFHNTTHHIYACNRVPLPPFQATNAFYRRFRFILFTQVFKDPRDPDFNPTKHKVANRDTLPKLKAEVEGVLAYWVSLLPYINELAVTNVAEVKDLWACHSDSALRFFMECTRHPDLQVNTSDLYQIYVDKIKADGETPASKKHFSSVLQSQGVEYKQVRIKGSVDERDREYIFKGVDRPGTPMPFDVNRMLNAPPKPPSTSEYVLSVIRAMEAENGSQAILKDDLEDRMLVDGHVEKQDVESALGALIKQGTVWCPSPDSVKTI